jgi:hypothetical protein
MGLGSVPRKGDHNDVIRIARCEHLELFADGRYGSFFVQE